MEYGAFATSAAKRVDGEEYGIDPATIVLILTQVLPLVMDCFMPMASSDRDIITRVRYQHRRYPRNLRRRLAARIRREAEEPMGYRLSYALADATIEECVNHEDRFIYGSSDAADDDDAESNDGTAG